MRSMIGRLALAAVLAVAAWVCWREADVGDAVAGAREHLATLRLDLDDRLQPVATVSDYMPGTAPSLASSVREHHASVAYWLARYQDVMSVGRDNTDARVLHLAANAAFRANQLDGGVGEAAVQRLDGILQAYALVLKAVPGDLDAAYNYEFVSRIRDHVARMPPPKAMKGTPPKPEPAPRQVVTIRAGDLPGGPTVHGRPGAPPPDPKGEPFEVITPMEYGDREAQPESTPGGKLPRKG